MLKGITNPHTLCLEFTINGDIQVSKFLSDSERARITEIKKGEIQKRFDQSPIDGEQPTHLESTVYAICDTLHEQGLLDEYMHDDQISLCVRQKGQKATLLPYFGWKGQ